jgi:hypothetical protein
VTISLLLRRRRLIAVALVAVFLAAMSCTFETSNSGSLYANVPYYGQEQIYYCTAACVQMIAKWSGANVTQQEAFAYMQGTISGGVQREQLVNGIRSYTSEGDAYLDQAVNSDNNYFARQISSVSNKVPLVALTDGGSHTVVLYGGSWHAVVDTSNRKTFYWDDVIFHDPSRGGGLQWTAGAWRSLHCSSFGTVCEQVISYSAALAGPRTLADYNPTVYATGDDDTGHDHGPYEY